MEKENVTLIISLQEFEVNQFIKKTNKFTNKNRWMIWELN